MKFLNMKMAAAVAVIGLGTLFFYACNQVGNGFGLDTAGDPIPAKARDTNLVEVQKIFTEKCITCHKVNSFGWSQTGGISNGLDLTVGNSYTSLLGSGTGQTTFEAPTVHPIYRVRPGSLADSSYLYQKIVAGGILKAGSARMPLSAAPLSDAEIYFIKRWIEKGALP